MEKPKIIKADPKIDFWGDADIIGHNNRCQKRSAIEKTYAVAEVAKIDPESLSLLQKVYLGTLLGMASQDDDNRIRPLYQTNTKLAPTIGYAKKILNTLTDNNIIVVAPDSDLDAFPDDPENVESSYTAYYMAKVSYLVNIDFGNNKEDIINHIKNPVKITENQKEEALAFWKEMAAEECKEYMIHRLIKCDLDVGIADRAIATFDHMLRYLSTSQIYTVIFISTAKAKKYYDSKDIDDDDAITRVISYLDGDFRSALSYGTNYKAYGRVSATAQSAVSKFLYDRMLKIGNLGFSSSPHL